ncbi:hypothetical protein A5482_003320 [Cyanobacterium sp. IPPAS B-1200]|uniref:hypothetical protein n=1 Tax=Cyanobacterium sp. IPPAS B-1200 TaxID=1562720 RepID=UPI0008524B25|nr:hypothetical protein [Cyanobacterium sp. IPPAS B-1200]OEJ78040.1 hypothetical protein A5482_04280 [Cyanobacterium sp. IPPAS B-1200]
MKISLLTNVLISIFFYSFLAGCTNERISSCRQLTNSISPIEEKMNDLEDNNLDMILDTAQTFELTSQTITNQSFEDDNLREYALRLSQVYQEYADNTKNFVDAYEKKDQEKGIFYQQQLINLFSRQQEIVQTINSYCI